MASGTQRIDLRTLKNGPAEWELLEVIGEGTYGSVYRGKNNHSGRFGAIKIIENVLNKAEEVQVELNVFRKHSLHPNIADFYGAYLSENMRGMAQLWMVLEYCDGGSVSDLVKRLIVFGSRLDESIISYIVSETLHGIKHLHDNLVIHRDIKGPNILLTSDARVKLIDFGVSAELAYSGMRRHSSVGTPFWMAPEVIACEQQLEYTYDFRCDIWSLGITAIEIADGEPPLADQHPMRALFKIPRNPPPTVKRPDKWSSNYLDFIASCLVKDFEQRPSVAEMLQHSFVAGVTERSMLIRQQFISLLSTQVKSDRKMSRAEKPNTGKMATDIRETYALLEIDDLATLETLNDEIIMQHLWERYAADQIYTYIGDILLAVNPFKEMGIYGITTAKLYQHEQKSDLPPHIFMVACSAYQTMMHKGKDQCCVISGESGAGKTVSSNFIIQHLAEIGDGGNHSLVGKILQVNPLMEAFGNAQTVINTNSSRFGKYLELHFNAYGSLIGAQLSEYLLEKSRVVSQSRGERNFHILYYLIAGLDYHRKLGHFDLSTTERHRYLNTDDQTLDEFSCTKDMQARFNLVQRSFNRIGFTQEEVQSLYCVLAAVIHIGDIEFIPDDEAQHQGEKSKVLNPDTLKTVSSLLCIKSNELGDALTTSSSVTRGETITRNNTIEQAIDCRDATAKALYGRLFSWMVKRVNSLLRSDDTPNDVSHKIGILDIFGFENFKHNSFEQLCINIANEQLQFYFNQHVFEWEFEEYQSEGINGQTITFENNRTILDLFLQKPMGMLALLDEESRFPKATDVTLVEKFADNLSPVHFTKPKDSNTTFVISHFAGKVAYDASFFLEKNRDNLSADILQVLRISDDKLVRLLFQGILDSQGRLLSLPDSKGNGAQQPKVGVANSANSFFLNTSSNGLPPDGKSFTALVSTSRLQFTVSTHFRNSLRNLLSKMINADPHFVRCVRPNSDNLPGKFDENKVMEQLRYTGVLETTRIRRQGFSHRILYGDFVNRYRFLLTPMHKEPPKDSATCRRILRAANLDANWRIGRSKVFLKYYHIDKLSRLLETFRGKVIVIQRNFRYYLARIKAEKKRVLREASALTIQTAVRGFLARRALQRLKDDKDKQQESALAIQSDEKASDDEDAYRGYSTRKKLNEEKARQQKEQNLTDSGFSFLERISLMPIQKKPEPEVFNNEEEQESIEETRIIYFLAQIDMVTQEVYPLLKRTTYPVLYSIREEADKVARKYRGNVAGDRREKILAVVDGVDDPEERIRWAREKFESYAELSRRSPKSPRTTGPDNLIENGRPDDPFYPGAYRVSARNMSAIDLSSRDEESPRDENSQAPKRIARSPGRQNTQTRYNQGTQQFVQRNVPDSSLRKTAYPSHAMRESREYPSRLAYENNGRVPFPHDEFEVTDFEWFLERRNSSFFETFANPATQKRPPRNDFPLRANLLNTESSPQHKKPINSGYPMHYRPYNYLTGNEVDSRSILPGKPAVLSLDTNATDLEVFDNSITKAAPPQPQHSKVRHSDAYVEKSDRRNTTSDDLKPTRLPGDKQLHGSTSSARKFTSRLENVLENEPKRRLTPTENSRLQLHTNKGQSNFPASLVKKFPTPKEKGESSGRLRNIYGFSYGIKAPEDGNLKEFPLRKTGRLQQLVPT